MVSLSLSIEDLLGLDPAGLDDAGLRGLLVDLGRWRSRLEAAEAVAIREFHDRAGFVADGAADVKGWLAHHTGVSWATAGSRARVALRLRRLPVLAGAWAAGEVTDGHVRALLRAVSDRTLTALSRDETVLVDQAKGLEADDFDRVVTRWLLLNDPDGPEPGGGRASEAHASRHFGGRGRLDADLAVDDAAIVFAELEHLADRVYRADQRTGDPARPRSQRLAAALVDMAQRSSSTRGSDGRGPARPLLVAVADVRALAGEVGHHAELDDGTLLPRAVLDQWACDCGIGRVVMAGRSIPFDLGAVTYTATDGQRRALSARDRGCIVPGCRRKPRWCQVHHVIPFPVGPTNLDNLVLACHRHHRDFHHGLLRLHAGQTPGTWVVIRPDGTSLSRPPPTLAA